MNKQSISTKFSSILNPQTIFYLSSFAIAVVVFMIPSLGLAADDWAAPATEFLETGQDSIKGIGRLIAGISVACFAVYSMMTQRINWSWAIGIGVGAGLLSFGIDIINAMTS